MELEHWLLLSVSYGIYCYFVWRLHNQRRGD